MHPFRIEISDSQINDLNRRIAATRWPVAAAGSGWERGVPQKYLKELATYWHKEYSWRDAEQRLNQYPQFTTDIDGANIHFLHVTSEEPGARPLLLTHSWPGSIVEFMDMIGPLTNPREHGGDPANAFHLVIPSLPGFGFSGPIAEPGWDVRRVATAWAELMRLLGYDSYLTSGEDWGAVISLELGRVDAEHVSGVHVAWPTVPSRDVVGLAKMSESDLAQLDQVSMSWFDSELSGYLRIQTTRPLTISYGLADSPVGQLAWIAEKFREWNRSATTPDDVVERDRLLTNVSIYWFTGTAGSSTQMHYESAASLGALFTPGMQVDPIGVPVGIAFFRQDPAPPFRAFGGLDASTITQWTTFEKGGHFGPMEEPRAFVDDLRAFAWSLPA